MPISIYPPTLKSTQPAFIGNVSQYPVEFTVQQVISRINVKHIQIRVTRQSNNKSIVKTSSYPDGIIYQNITLDQNQANYTVQIMSTDLTETWQPGFLYKIQLRFGTTPIFTSVSEFADWKKLQITNQTFSEWSTVMIVKAISEPTVYIKNMEAMNADVYQSDKIEPSTTPRFVGVYNIDEDSKEAEDVYKFTLYKGNRTEEEAKLEESKWLQHDATQDSVDYYRFKTVLKKNNQQQYTVTYQIKTVNGYEASAQPYTFVVNQSFLSQIEGISFSTEDSTPYCAENGCINIYLSSTQEVSGSFVISRASEKDNFQVFEDIKFMLFNKKHFTEGKQLVFQDFTIESGIKYKYALQQENRVGLRTDPLFEEYNAIKVVNFEYAFLYHDDIQLRLQFNNSMSSFKHTVLSSKQDTLGSKYPHITKNGYAYYAEFPISGLISLHMDEDQTFFKRGTNGYYYHGELVIPNDKFLENDTEETFDQDLTHNNIFVERIFREKVEEFLNNFDYKLYKSPTEGNIIVVLQNISLTPKQELGRMLFDFSATAYEVLENTIENLNEYKIIDIGSFQTLATEETTPSFGQIHGLYSGKYTLTGTGANSRYTSTTPVELLNEIKKLEEVPITGGYKTSVKKITALYIEQYPWVEYKAELTELEAQKNILANLGEDTTEIEAEIAKYEALEEYIKNTPENKIAILVINGREIVMGLGKIYQLADIDEDITSIQLKFTGPIIINYLCQLIQVEDKNVGVVSSIDASRIWGQVQGIFTTNDEILKQYNFRYDQTQTDRIYNIYEDSTIIKGIYGDVILDNTNMNLYKSMDIMKIIKQETKRQVEVMYKIANGFTNYDESTKQWDNGTVYYEFQGVYLLDIEADPGTILYVGKSADGSNKVEVTIGATGRYILNPSTELVNYVAFKFPQYAIINYKCMTSQMTKTKEGE